MKKELEGLTMEVANELGIRDYATADKGNMTSRQNGSVGGYVVKKIIEEQERKMR